MSRFGGSGRLVSAVVGFVLWSGGIMAPARATDGGEDAFDRTFKRSIDRLQDALEEKEELWIDRSQWENAWVLETEHYSIRYTGSRKNGGRYHKILEDNYYYLREFLEIEPAVDSPLNVFVFPDIDAYNQYSTSNNAGAYSSITGGYYHVTASDGPAVTYSFSHEPTVNRWLVHGAVHQFLSFSYQNNYASLGGRGLDWTSVGLASYFELFQDWSGSCYHFNELIKNKSFIPLRNLLGTNAANFSHRHFIELGMFFYYMIHLREGTRTERDEEGNIIASPFRDYLVKVIQGGDLSGDAIQKLMTPSLLQDHFRDLEQDFKSRKY